jgi:pimeloyl-ACP methyl ester carboxylesterase
VPTASGLYYAFHQGSDLETPPVVLIHGAGGSSLHWPAEVRRLPRYRVFGLDLPGHGKSEGRGQQSIGAYAGQIQDWLLSLNLPRAVFIGHSLGAAIALETALEYPEHVFGLGLLGAGARLPLPEQVLADALNATTYHKAIQAVVDLSFSPTADPRLVELASIRMGETRSSVLHGDFLACAGFDVSEKLGKVHQPTLILCGADDRLTPPRFSQLMASLIRDSRLEIIPQAGHMVMLEQPQAVAERLVQFLDSIPYIAG